MIEIREISDISELMKWREEVICNVFGLRPERPLLEANREYYKRNIHEGSHLAFVVSKEGEDVGVGAICLSEELPSPDNPTGLCAYLMNVYVRDKYRNHGVASALVAHLTDVAERLGCGKIYLESTDMAKPLYRQCGFTDMENMMKYED